MVRYTDDAVLAAVPGRPGRLPAGQFITLITRTPLTLAFTPWRIVVTGTLITFRPAMVPPGASPAVRRRGRREKMT